MSILCNGLREYCKRNEYAANTFAFLGAASLLATIWVAIDFQLVILSWVSLNPLVHGLMLGGATLGGSLLIFGLLCLGFSEHTHEHKTCVHAYRGRGKGKPLFPGVHRTIEHLGMNPRWRLSRERK
ncbi:MAG: hypothetical protein H7840_14295 [Alphaproteobacteria bacterium]